jgi:apolipoprotein N-acyltransferase
MIALLVILGGATWLVLRERQRSPEYHYPEPGLLRLAGVFALFSAVYGVFITFSFLFSTPRNDLDGRLLSPIYLALFLAFFPLLAWVLSALKAGNGLTWVSPALLALVVAGGLGRSIEFVQNNHQNGAGYTSKVWQSSATLQAVKRLDPAVTVISNESAAILFLANRPAYDVVQTFLSSGNELVPVYGNDPNDPAQRLFQDGEAVLVIFTDYFYWQLFPLYGDQTQQAIDSFFQNMQIEAKLADGVIYRYATP